MYDISMSEKYKELYTRIDIFKRYKKNWDSGVGEPLSDGSITLFKMFLDTGIELENPSIFLTRSGNLELQIEGVVIEFFHNKIEYCFTDTGEEGEFSINDLNILIKRLIDNGAFKSDL